ncbi:uracil-DNA glycosylase [Halovulum sp. GXIMD14793]
MTNPVHIQDQHDLLAALAWQIELGADEAILDTPVDRYALGAAPAKAPQPAKPPPAEAAPPVDPGETTAALAAGCADLDALKAAMAGFEGCALKQGARNLVFADGVRGARVMIVGEAPGREEDRQGLPFVGPSGQLLDKMFAAIGLSRQAEDPKQGIYITNTLPWRPPQNRDPSTDELAMMLPFLHRHIELAAPDILVTMGNPSTKTLLKTNTGITRMRGKWAEVMGIPTLPMFHPAALLRGPEKKREAWADLLALKARLS